MSIDDHEIHAAGDDALDPTAALALLRDQQRSIEGQLGGFVPVIMLTWGLAWLLGFGALWLIDGARPGFALPLGAAIAVFCVLLAVAIAVSTVLGIRSSRGIRSTRAAAFTGAAYGCTWWVGCLGIAALGGGLVSGGMSPAVANLFYPSAYVMFSGIMFIVAGAIWQAVPSVVLGGWTVLIAAVAPYFGYPTHYLFLAIAGGVGFLALGAASLVRLRSLRRRVVQAGASGASAGVSGAPSRG